MLYRRYFWGSSREPPTPRWFGSQFGATFGSRSSIDSAHLGIRSIGGPIPTRLRKIPFSGFPWDWYYVYLPIHDMKTIKINYRYRYNTNPMDPMGNGMILQAMTLSETSRLLTLPWRGTSHGCRPHHAGSKARLFWR